MRRSKYGYLLLALLVTTGLAGTITSTSINNKERKFAVSLMKDTKNDVEKTVQGLSRAQLNFKPASGKWSIKECVYHIALSEKDLWKIVDNAMKNQANPEKRSEIKMTDDQVVKMTDGCDSKFIVAETLEPKNIPWKNVEEALNFFEVQRTAHIKYMKNSTEDLRNHVVQTSFGSLDCYQLCLLLASHSNQHARQINELRSGARFPKK